MNAEIATVASSVQATSSQSVPTQAPQQPSFNLTAPPSSRTQMRVTKRNGAREAVDVNKIVRAVTRSCDGLSDVDPMRVALKTIAGLYDGATTRELDELSIRTAASFMFEEPEYSRLAARLLAGFIDKEVERPERALLLAVDSSRLRRRSDQRARRGARRSERAQAECGDR